MLAFLFHCETGKAMSIFMPDYLLHSVLDVTPEFLKKLDVSAVLLDVDNTLGGLWKTGTGPGHP